MIQTVNLYAFRRAFEMSGRDNFSYEGQRVLFEYLERLEEETGTPIAFDVVALCCEFAEDDYHSVALNYSIALDDNGLVIDYEDELKDIVGTFLRERTSVCGEVKGGFVYAIF